MSINIETKKLQDWFETQKRDGGLFDVKFYPGEVAELTKEGFCAEVNQFLSAFESANFIPFSDNIVRKPLAF